ncbi:MAG: cytochrome c biogenesis protein CcsA [Calditrichaeota bacterium]|nr:cytochrome c biogenesis protein CcsA [Calditrichota bacterium]
MKIFTFFWMVAVIIGSLYLAPEAAGFKSTSRVIFYHVPMSWVASLAFLVAAISGILYLRTKKLVYDIWAVSSVEIGFLFSILATITGSLWAKVEWGAFWNWDPRETSIVVLLMIYAAYFALRSALESREQKAQISAVYSILAFITVPFLVFVVPRILFTLHPQNPVFTTQAGKMMSPKIKLVFFSSMFGFTLFYYWLLRLRVNLERIKEKML